MSICDDDWGDVQPARLIKLGEQEQTGLIRRASNFVAPERAYPVIPSRHEIVDPYAPNVPQPVQLITRHEYTPNSRARAMIIKTSAITIFLAILTLSAMLMLDSWSFLAWLFIASLEWVFCFWWLARYDWRETPSALGWKMSEDYKELMEREQRARLKAVYGYVED